MLIMAIDRLWYAVPLLVATCLVYGASRHEVPRAIISHAWRFGVWIIVFMAVLYGLIWLITALL